MPVQVTTTKSHPFIDGLKKLPDKKKELQKVRAWLLTQPHLPDISDEYIFLFLHACFYSVDRTKICIENYFTLRSSTPMIFAGRNAYDPKLQAMLQLAHLARLPKLTPEGYRVLMYSLRDPDPTKMIFNDAVKGFCMYNDCILSEDGLQDGYVIIFDMKGVSIGHLARVSLPALRAFLIYIQEAHPARLKSVHILNTASWIHHIMRIVVPMVKSDMLSLLKFHKGNTPEGIPLEILPMDYGGEAPTIQELDEEVKSLVDKYAVWLKETELFKTDESKRIKKTTWWGLLTGSNSKSTENMDEKTFLKNLQID
ncbi:alpha-tocopherol transfer protein-like [Harmonia axyridis]|uniref:alpha-tocopherol transfer protein-like n=1 Tax=Harmonia axyridis TaxID=115357 RepID=UPI001E278959|nr:alpha-tocopherol transfer protein-like [Harmonia axyridis]